MKRINFDLVIMGATGFTGKLVVEYILKNYGLHNKNFSWAIASRNPIKLKSLKDSLEKIHPESLNIPEIVADCHDQKSLDKMTSQCRIIISTVGPYLKYGHLLVKSCAENGTHYCDLTGEVPFIKESIDQFDKIAKENNCKIIHSCGFDSVPSDLGVLLLQDEAKKRFNLPCERIKLYVHGMGGGFSGGTIASGIHVYQYVKNKPHLKKALRDPYSLVPDKVQNIKVSSPSLRSVKWDSEVGRWICPFVMAGINTKIVRRSNGMMDNAYGNNFLYNEVYSFSKGLTGFLKAFSMTFSLAVTIFFMKYNFSLKLLQKFFFPDPGQGPSREKRESGFFRLRLVGYTKNDQMLSLFVEGDSDPGYSATAKMIAESALSIILNEQDIPKAYGILTPASGIGETLEKRLKDKGIRFLAEN